MNVIACLAATLDGKIASAHDKHARIGSQRDLQHLRNVRNLPDAILCGGETFREYPNVRRGGDTNRPVPLQCVLTRTFNLPPAAPLFKADPAVPVLIFGPERPPEEIRTRYPHHVEWLGYGDNHPARAIAHALQERGIHTLLVEGGGHVMQLFLETRLLQELYLTTCPLLLGGKDDPALVSGPGFAVPEAPRTEILSLERVANELFLHLKLIYPKY